MMEKNIITLAKYDDHDVAGKQQKIQRTWLNENRNKIFVTAN